MNTRHCPGRQSPGSDEDGSDTSLDTHRSQLLRHGAPIQTHPMPAELEARFTTAQLVKLPPVAKWQHLLRCAVGLSAPNRHVALAISTWGPVCFASIETLVASTAHGRTTVRSSIARLDELGWLELELQGFGGRRAPRVKRLLWPPEGQLCDRPSCMICGPQRDAHGTTERVALSPTGDLSGSRGGASGSPGDLSGTPGDPEDYEGEEDSSSSDELEQPDPIGEAIEEEARRRLEQTTSKVTNPSAWLATVRLNIAEQLEPLTARCSELTADQVRRFLTDGTLPERPTTPCTECDDGWVPDNHPLEPCPVCDRKGLVYTDELEESAA